MQLFTRELTQEHERARQVKRDKRITVCIGNPPYDRQERQDENEARRGGWIRAGDGTVDNPQNAPLESFLAPARAANAGRHLKNLYNDYVYFWRWALWKTLEANQTGSNMPGGIVCFITASSYLRGPGFVGMRRVMRESFDELWILDLEGDSRGARKTENVFNIQTGVAIALGVRVAQPNPTTPARVRYAKIEGTRNEKKTTLAAIQKLADIPWNECPDDWEKPFLPRTEADYWNWPEITALFPWQFSGVQFKRSWPIGETQELLTSRWQTLTSAPLPQKKVLMKESGGRRVSSSYDDAFSSTRLPPLAQEPANSSPSLSRYSFRSFDRHWAVADTRICDRIRPALWKSYGPRQMFLTSLLTEVLGDGPALVACAHIPDLHHFSGRGGKDVIPFWRDAAGTLPNITAGVLERLGAFYGQTVAPVDLFAAVYALLFPRAFVARFADELTIPGPRVPLPRDPALFGELAALGHQLLRLHSFGERDFQSAPSRTVMTGTARNLQAVELWQDAAQTQPTYPQTFGYDLASQTLHVGNAGRFGPVSPAVWEYSVSGLRVVGSWLSYRMKERAGRKSSPLDDLRPTQWTNTLTRELLELLWTLEHTLDLEPQATQLLDRVLASPIIPETEFPTPSPDEIAAPGETESESAPAQGELNFAGE